MKNIYIYPVKEKYSNPYISNLINAIVPFCKVINRNAPTTKGIFSILPYLQKVDYIWFNWIEDVADKRGGYFQTVFTLLLFYYCQLTSKKIIWTLHNKFSHTNRNKVIKKFLFKQLMLKSNYILTHSSEGLVLTASYGKEIRNKTLFIHHPFTGSLNLKDAPKTTDMLIWGNIIPYKGVDVFLKYLKDNNLDHEWTIRVIGRIPDAAYRAEVLLYSNENITFEERFIDTLTLQNEISSSKYVLFTYLKDSVLSSGAVMDSISMGAKVIGPHCGAFIDLKNAGIIETYHNLDELVNKLSTPHTMATIDIEKTSRFINENSWEYFGSSVSKWLRLT